MSWLLKTIMFLIGLAGIIGSFNVLKDSLEECIDYRSVLPGILLAIIGLILLTMGIALIIFSIEINFINLKDINV